MVPGRIFILLVLFIGVQTDTTTHVYVDEGVLYFGLVTMKCFSVKL